MAAPSLARRAPHLVVAVAVACATLLAACGASKQPAGISHAEYVKRIDAICTDIARRSAATNRGLQALIDANGSFESRLKKAAPLLRTTLRLQTSKVERFERVAVPKGGEAEVHLITTNAKGFLGDLRKAIPVAARGDLPDFIDFVTDASGNRSRVERYGVDYGIRDDCFTLPIKFE